MFYNVKDPRFEDEKGYRLYRISDIFCSMFENLGFRCVQRIIWWARNRMPIKQAKEFLADGKRNQARFTLQKLLLVNPLHQEANKLYKSLKEKTPDASV